jgi:hypothetical protein
MSVIGASVIYGVVIQHCFWDQPSLTSDSFILQEDGVSYVGKDCRILSLLKNFPLLIQKIEKLTDVGYEEHRGHPHRCPSFYVVGFLVFHPESISTGEYLQRWTYVQEGVADELLGKVCDAEGIENLDQQNLYAIPIYEHSPLKIRKGWEI